MTVTISCLVSFKDITLDILPGMESERLITGQFTSPLDRYRSRQ